MLLTLHVVSASLSPGVGVPPVKRRHLGRAAVSHSDLDTPQAHFPSTGFVTVPKKQFGSMQKPVGMHLVLTDMSHTVAPPPLPAQTHWGLFESDRSQVGLSPLHPKCGILAFKRVSVVDILDTLEHTIHAPLRHTGVVPEQEVSLQMQLELEHNGVIPEQAALIPHIGVPETHLSDASVILHGVSAF